MIKGLTPNQENIIILKIYTSNKGISTYARQKLIEL